MESERNIQLTVIRPPEENDEIQIDLATIFDGLKRFFVLWLAFAVALGTIAGASGLLWQNWAPVGDAMALIGYSGNGEYDATKLQSPNVVEAAINMLGVDLRKLDKIRTCIKIEGVMSDEAYDRRTLYYNLLSKSSNMEAVRSLLDTDDNVTRYIVSFDYKEAGFTREEGITFLNELISAYRKYFKETYNYNMPMGNSVNVIDYRDYDYAEAAHIFSETLDDIESYLTAVSRSDTGEFRSSKTGYTFNDLTHIASMLEDIELDRVTSYITIHSVTANDPAGQISHYEWLIESLVRRRTVQEAKLESLQSSIAAYEKDPVIFVAGEAGATQVSESDALDNYDMMIREELDTQQTISGYTRTISYYESVIEGFRTTTSVAQRDIDKVEGYLESLNEKINQLIRDVNVTADEYYDKAAFANTVRVLVPALAETPSLLGEPLKFVAVTEAVLMVIYLAVAVVYGLEKSNPRKKPQNLINDVR